jgi:hypothetical protein
MGTVRQYHTDEELSEKTSTSTATLACEIATLTAGVSDFVAIGTAFLHLESGTAARHTMWEDAGGSVLSECVDYEAINTEDGFVGAPTMVQSIDDTVDPIQTYAWGIA